MKNRNLSVILIFLCSCSTTGQHKKCLKDEEMPAIKVSRLFPLMENTGRVIKYDPQFAEIYYHRNEVLYKTPYSFTFHSMNGTIIKEEKRIRYLRHTIGDQYGYYFDSSLSVFNQKVLVDSMLKKEWYGADFLSAVFEKTNAQLTSSVKDETAETLNEVYTVVAKTDTSQTGSVVLTYSNELKDIPYTLSKVKDSLKSMKLIKAKIINNPRRIETSKFNVDKIEQTREITKIPIPNRDAILKYFEQLKPNPN